MRCETCQKAQPSLATRVKHVNEALYDLGKTYHPALPTDAIDRILQANGFLMVHDAVSIETEAGSAIHANVGECKWLHVNWHVMESKRLEVVAYLN